MEILVALAIGLLLTAGVIQIFVANKQSYRLQENLSRMQEDGRFAISQLSSILRMTGYKTDPTDILTFAGGALSGSDGNGTSDQISISFQGAADGKSVDCLGNPITPATTSTNQFLISGNNLRCTATTGSTSVTQDLINNVEDMQITYGVDDNGNGSASYYVAAGSVAAWNQVVSVRISLLLRTNGDNLVTNAQTYRYNGSQVTASDRRLREVFSTTIALRNNLP